MKLRDWYYSLSLEDRAEFARRVGTTTNYFRKHILPRLRPPDRIPREDLLVRIKRESGLTRDDVLKYYYRKL